MSMSSLGQQLAAINGPGNNTGSTLSTSRQHKDAIGRGLSHSVQLGHASYNKDHKYKASIIHEDARKASDVPLATIRENCLTSLRQLETIDTELGVFAEVLCKNGATERGLLSNTENNQIDKYIVDLLYRISLVMGYKQNSNLVSCLNVIEFLLRKYEIHIRPKTASTMLLVMLPHHEEPYFLRILQLIDLANLPEWSFLRPYAVPGARLGRSILAKTASKDITFIRALGRLSECNSKMPFAQQSLSFTAAVLIEALTLQTQRKGSMEEQTCQAILPFVIAACRNEKYYRGLLNGKKYPEGFDGSTWQNWGYIMASTMVETSIFAPEFRSLLVTSILYGLALQQESVAKSIEKYGTSISSEMRREWSDILNSISSGLIVTLTILSQNSTGSSIREKSELKDSCYLPLLKSSMASSSVTMDIANKRGFSMMDKVIFNALMKLDDYDIEINNTDHNEDVKSKNIRNSSNVAACIANLYHKDGIVDIEQWVASILVFGWKRVVKYHKHASEEACKKNRKACKILNLILNLLKHPHLEKLWIQMDGQWIVSFISFIYLNSPTSMFESMKCDVNEDEKSQFSEDGYMTAILQTLRSLDKVAYERGMMHSLIKTKNKKDRMSLAKHLGLSKPDAVDTTSSTRNISSIKLPPRVGLENADDRIRLESISILLKEAKNENIRMSIDAGDTMSEGEIIAHSLFRRFLVDDSKQVAIAAAKAFDELLCFSDENIWDDSSCAEMSEWSLEALYKWFQCPSDDDKLKDKLLAYSCRFAAYAVKALRALNQIDLIFFRLMEGLGALLSDPDATVSLEAAKGIVTAYDENGGSNEATKVKKQAKYFLISDERILRGFSRSFSERNSSEFHFRRQLSHNILEAICTAEPSTTISKESLEYSIWLIEVFGNNLQTHEINAVGKSLVILANRITIELGKIHSTFCRLSSSGGSVFDVAIAPYIRATCDKIRDSQGGTVSPVAILMEIILSSDSSDQIENLLSVANKMISKDMIGLYYAIVPTLALCCHQEEKIRRLSVSFLCHLSKELQKVSNEEAWMVLIPVCNYFSENKSSVVLRGASFLSESFTTILSNSNNAESIRKYLLQAILCSVVAYGSTDSVSSTDYFAKSWLSSRDLVGGYKAGIALLTVTESAGEAAFPIMARWEGIGQPLLSAFLSQSYCTSNEVSFHQSDLIHLLVKILRGATISTPSNYGTPSTSTIITIGPSPHGRRARSYSFGKNDGIGSLEPYPTSMQNMIVSILAKITNNSFYKEIQASLFDIVLCSHTWRKKIFSRLNGKVRQKIASAMLVAATESLFHDIDSTILSLPLDANDIAKLLSGQEHNEFGLSKLTFISDFIKTNHSKLAMSSRINELFASIFERLTDLNKARESFDSVEFTRHALLCALLELIKSSLEVGSMDYNLGTKKRIFDLWLNTLLNTVVAKSDSRKNFVPIRSKRIVFLIFASLCDKNPKIIIPKFISLITGIVSASLSNGEQSKLFECFDIAIPIYFKHAPACNLSPSDLFRSFINHVCTCDEATRPKYYAAFVQALAIIPENDVSEASPIGSFVSAVLAREGYCSSDNNMAELLYSKLPSLAKHILPRTSYSRIQAVWTLQNYAKEIIFDILREEIPNATDSVFPVQHLIEIAAKGPNSTGEISSNQSPAEVASSLSSSSVLDRLSSLLIFVTCEVVTSHESQTMIECTSGSGSMIILRLWQDLLLIQSACQNRLGGSNSHHKSDLLNRIVEITTQALESIQSNLPSHIFLAFVTNLVTEGETQELRARAVQLIAERSASSYLGKSETTLFVEMIPSLLQLLVPNMSNGKNKDGSGQFLHQSIFAAIDSIGRNSCLSFESDVNDRQLQIFSDVTFQAALVLEKQDQSSNSTTFLDIPSESRQLISSAALCISTAMKICGPRALPVLHKLIKPSLNILDCVSTFMDSSTIEIKTADKKELSQAKLMQLAIVRAIRSIIEEMPKLLKPYLVGICNSFSKVYSSFHGDSSNQSQSIEKAMVALQSSISSHIPTRQLIPAASKSIFSMSNVDLSLPTLSIMIECVTNSKSAEVSGMIGLITKTATYIFDRNASQEVMHTTDELLLCLVMKLSEVQLRSLYRNIREWRGSLDKANPEETGAKRSAFWRFSAALSKKLKSIYLSCFTSVFSDVVDELDVAVLCLSKINSVKKSNGKKQKLSSSVENSSFQSSSLQALKNLLLCLEISLRSDAHEGGVWIRELESQRYEKLLEPLGKLLFCQIPFDVSDTTFKTLVQGNESQSGSVVECLVALATAAGDEQLWKPLNHSVVQACSDENRLEVRKAGVSCLLSLINSIGEEYMVLIPECLPILSELLEDSDEEVAAAAQECISQSEELLGESLQESLW